MLLFAEDVTAGSYTSTGLRLAFYVIIIATVLLWYTYRLRYRNVITVEFSRITRVITNKILEGRPAIYGPGTYYLPPTEKVLEYVDTNVRNRPESGPPLREKFRAGSEQAEFELLYVYQVYYKRSAASADPLTLAHDAVLDYNVLLAYESFDKEEERFEAVQQIVSEQIETAGRTFSPGTLSDADRHPCDMRVSMTGKAGDPDRKITGIIRVHEYDNPHNLPPLPDPDNLGAVLRINSELALFSFIRHFVMDRTNDLIAKWGLEVPSFSVHDIPYAREDLQTRAEKVYEARLLEEAVDKLLQSGRAATPQEAMLIALGQDAQYGNLVIHQRWQELIRDITTPDQVRNIIQAIVNR